MTDHRAPLHVPNRGDRFGGDPEGWRRTWVEETARQSADDRKTEAVRSFVKFVVTFAVAFVILNAVRQVILG
jgi:hypothetical protein